MKQPPKYRPVKNITQEYQDGGWVNVGCYWTIEKKVKSLWWTSWVLLTDNGPLKLRKPLRYETVWDAQAHIKTLLQKFHDPLNGTTRVVREAMPTCEH